MMSEFMVPVDARCIPDGYEPEMVGVPNTGDMV